MSSHGWPVLYRIIQRAARRLPRPKRRFEYSDALIGAMFFWAVWHDRPQCWAAERTSYHGVFRPRRLPSNSEFNRRVRSARFAELLTAVFAALRPARAPGGTLVVDARPLPVGPCSKDRAAKAGRVYGGFARGYRLHALVDAAGFVQAFRLTAMNTGEPDMALELLGEAVPGETVLSDGVNDSMRLYDAAEARGVRFRARPPRQNAGHGHRPQSAARLRGVAEWHAHATEYQQRRGAIERVFGWQSSFGGGLSPLPAWVRTPTRTLRWVTAKLTLYHVRRSQKCHAA
jgi:hypothetical protein